MREILFRGKHTRTGEWVEGLLWRKKYNDNKLFISCFPDEDDNEEVFIIYPETIGQYTGLTDKNGKKIFECDILEFNYTGNNKGVEGKAVVVFENGKFGVKWGWHKEFVALDGFANTTLTVIGNLHDNPELLKERE